ncbi:unnamed protein product [Caenorhabditis angaria]|uniref:RRM domain-containing protein n=1 Tax=Caenorhabditis angaria TaxID=860376 RepID=A0A9P1J0T2_9PELO|nr:unnamed protein product [Caenorhabditis angaria]
MYHGSYYPPELAEMIQAGAYQMMTSPHHPHPHNPHHPRGMPPTSAAAAAAAAAAAVAQWNNGYPMIHPLELHQLIRQGMIGAIPQHQDSPPQLRKLFIGGLSHETTDEQLGNYYAQWGPVVDAIVIRDNNTKQSRGFGFVTFASIFSADAAMKDRPHVLGGKTVDSKRAIPREQMSSMIPQPFFECDPAPGCKLLLSGIIPGVHSVDALRIYFETFGTLDQVEILGHPRGFGFVIYEEKESADRCLSHNSGRHIVNERRIDVRVFVKNANGSTYWKRPQQQNNATNNLFEQLSHMNLKDSDGKSGTDTTGNSSTAAETPQNFDEESNYGGTTTEDDCNAFDQEELSDSPIETGSTTQSS